MSINTYLNQTFPYPGKKWITNVLLLSFFVSVFLLLFQPIDIDLPYKQIILAGYGLISFAVGCLLHLIFLSLFPNVFKEETWTIKKHLLWFAFQLFFIGIANHYYSVYLLPFHPKGIEGLLIFQLRVIELGVFPITMHIIFTHNILLTKNLKETIEINKYIVNPIKPPSSDDTICLTTDNEKDTLELHYSELYFIESVGNYIQVYYKKNGNLKNTLLRCSLKRAESALATNIDIVKCHRAYLINIRQIKFVKGNSQGYRLCIKDLEKEIPVARNYSKIVKEKIKEAHQ